MTDDKCDYADILVIGDSFIDEYLYCSCQRINPQSAAALFDVEDMQQKLGGAANVAANIASLSGKTVQLVAYSVNDELKDLCSHYNVDIHDLQQHGDKHTIYKKRFINNHKHVLRVDYETYKQWMPRAAIEQGGILETTINRLLAQSPNIKWLILSDYQKTMFKNYNYMQSIINTCSLFDVRIILDPKKSWFKDLEGLYMACPNYYQFYSNDHCNHCDETDVPCIITCGQDGLVLRYKDCNDVQKKHVIKGISITPIDPCGCGDIVTAVFTMGKAIGKSDLQAAQYANIVAAYSATKLGTNIISPQEVDAFIKEYNLK